MGPLSEVGDIFIVGSVTNLSTMPLLKRKFVGGSPCLSLDARCSSLSPRVTSSSARTSVGHLASHVISLEFSVFEGEHRHLD